MLMEELDIRTGDLVSLRRPFWHELGVLMDIFRPMLDIPMGYPTR